MKIYCVGKKTGFDPRLMSIDREHASFTFLVARGLSEFVLLAPINEYEVGQVYEIKISKEEFEKAPCP